MFIKINGGYINTNHIVNIVVSPAYDYNNRNITHFMIYLSTGEKPMRFEIPTFEVSSLLDNIEQCDKSNKKDITELQDKIAFLENKIKELEEQIICAPGGPIYNQSFQHFNTIIPKSEHWDDN